jgi:hypothetical protein
MEFLETAKSHRFYPMNPRYLFCLRLAWISVFNVSLLLVFIFSIPKLSKTSRALTFIFIALLLTIFLIFLFLEIVVRKHSQRNDVKQSLVVQSPHRKLLEQMLFRIPNAPFNVDMFLIELDDYYRFGLTKKILRSRVSTDYNGMHINIQNGIRNGIRPPSNFGPKLYLLGGSTVSCLEGPDNWTLPSRIQVQLNNLNIEKHVINLGVSGATVFDRFIAAREQIQVNPGDTLFFWFGVNEGKGLWGRRGRGPLRFWPGFVELFSIVRKHFPSVIFSWLYLELIVFDKRAHRRLARLRAAKLRRSFDDEIHKWSDLGVKVLAGLQPTIFSALSKKEDREFLAKNWKPEMMDIMNVQYDEFRSSFVGATYFSDLSNSTNADPSGSFVDWAHLSWRGNELVAQEIHRLGILKDY